MSVCDGIWKDISYVGLPLEPSQGAAELQAGKEVLKRTDFVQSELRRGQVDVHCVPRVSLVDKKAGERDPGERRWTALNAQSSKSWRVKLRSSVLHGRVHSFQTESRTRLKH